LQHGLAVIEDFAIGKANNGVAAFVEPGCADLIIFHLFGMRITIDLNAQFCFGAIEVDDEAIDGVLSPDL
jgi:hypothetical protein